MDGELSAEMVLAVAGAVVSLVFSYFPILRTRFAGLSAEAKSGVMILTLLLITAGMFGLGCAGVVRLGVGCDGAGAQRAVLAFVMALASNQGTWQITKNLVPADVKSFRV